MAGFVLAFVRTRVLLPSLGIALDLFLAGALLRLTGDATLGEVLLAAIVVAVRQATELAARRRTAPVAG